MNQPFYVEIVSRNGEVQRRYRVDSLPIRIGRAYDNQIILDDPHTAAHHAVVEATEDGQLVIRDLESRNGVVHQRQRLKELVLGGNTVVRLGHTNLRVRRHDFMVADELTDSTNHRWEGWPPMLAGFLLISIQTAFAHWLNQTGKIEPLDYLNQIATMGISMVFWSGAWALANHLFSGQLRFGRHLFIAACGMMASEVWSLISVYLAYAFSLEFFTRFSGHFDIVIIASVLFFHVATVIPRRRQRLLLIAVLLAFGASGLKFISSYQNNGRLAGELYMHALLPASVRQSRDDTVDEFVDKVGQMKASLDKAQQEEIDPEDLEKGEEPKEPVEGEKEGEQEE
jgi:hypothetical protein